MKHRMSKKLTTMITILVILLLLLPAGVLFADSVSGGGGKKPQPTDIEQQDTEETEETEETEATEETGNENSAAVALRIVDAAALEITPGHLNLIDKLYEMALAAAQASDPTATIIQADFRLLWKDASSQAINHEISRLRFLAKGKEFPGNPQNPEEMTIETDSEEEDGTGASHGKALGKGHNK